MRFTVFTVAGGLVGLGLLTYLFGAAGWWLILAVFAVILLAGWAVGRSMMRGDRLAFDAVAVAAVVAISITVAVVGFRGPADQPAQDTADRSAVVTAAREAVTALMTFAPGHGFSQSVADRLTDPLLTDYRGSGPDVVLTGAVESGTTMSAAVVAGAVDRQTSRSARVLLYVDQTVTTGGQPAQHIPLARWASLVRDGSAWLLSDLRPVGVQN
jgi:Mce-associated membrane protein